MVLLPTKSDLEQPTDTRVIVSVSALSHRLPLCLNTSLYDFVRKKKVNYIFRMGLREWPSSELCTYQVNFNEISSSISFSAKLIRTVSSSKIKYPSYMPSKSNIICHPHSNYNLEKL